jgi:hypothetical protein
VNVKGVWPSQSFSAFSEKDGMYQYSQIGLEEAARQVNGEYSDKGMQTYA